MNESNEMIDSGVGSVGSVGCLASLQSVGCVTAVSVDTLHFTRVAGIHSTVEMSESTGRRSHWRWWK